MKKNDLNIQKLRADDYDDLIDLWNRAGLPCRKLGRDSREHIINQLGNNSTCFLVCRKVDRIIASVLATHDGRRGWINRLAVLPEYQRQGIASLLLETAEKWLREQNILITACLIDNWNTSSMTFFQKKGYLKHENITYFTKRKSPDI